MKYQKFLLSGASIAAAFAAGSAANAAVVVLDFDGVANPNNSAIIDGYYNGGTSSDGNSGPNYGVTFSSNALALNNYNGSGEPSPGILYFLGGAQVFVNYAAGFDTGFSFFYASNSSNGLVTVYDDVDGTGNVLANFALANNFSVNCGYCVWDPIGVGFAGIAKSISFRPIRAAARFPNRRPGP
jgi:hypothetical protein